MKIREIEENLLVSRAGLALGTQPENAQITDSTEPEKLIEGVEAPEAQLFGTYPVRGFKAPREGVFPIPLTRGMTAWVDVEDYPKVAGLRWQPLPANGGNFYAKAGRYPTLLLHRVIMEAQDDELIDHEDGNGLHCWRSNLRRATAAQNQFNRGSLPGSSSRFKGVTLTPTGRWRAKIRANNVEYRLGTFDSEEVAARVYDNAARELHGKFAHFNFPDQVEAA